MKNHYEGLDGSFVARLRCFEKSLAEEGIEARLVCGLRSLEEQRGLYAIGRRGIAGERIVTRARPGRSYHNFGLAADYAVGQLSSEEREKFGLLAERAGLTWGGRWRMRDYGHVEWRVLPLAELRSGKRLA